MPSYRTISPGTFSPHLIHTGPPSLLSSHPGHLFLNSGFAQTVPSAQHSPSSSLVPGQTPHPSGLNLKATFSGGLTLPPQSIIT